MVAPPPEKKGAARRGRGLLMASVSAAAAIAGLSSSVFVLTQTPRSLRQRSPVTLAATGGEDASRRGILLSGAAAGLVASTGAQPAAADWGVRNVFPLNLPDPDPDPFVRRLQKRSWSMEPIFRQRLYLKAMRQGLMQRGELGLGNEKYFVHWTAQKDKQDFYKYDILDNKNFNAAVSQGLLLADKEMTDTEEELMVFVYRKPEDQAYVEENLGVLDRVECTQELIDMIELIKKTPFPEYKPPAKPGKPKEDSVLDAVNKPFQDTFQMPNR